MALWEDRSRRPVGRSRWFPHNSAVRAPRLPGTGRNDPPKTPRPGPRGVPNPSSRAAVGLTGVVSAVLGRCRRGRMCGIGPVEAVLHIRSGSAGGGSAESCGNALAFNVVEILPCAESSCLHMGARALKTDVLGRIAESCGKLGVGPRGSRPPMCNTPQSVVRPHRVRVPSAAGGRGPRPGRRARAGAAHGMASLDAAPAGRRARAGIRDDGRRPAARAKWRSGRIVPPRTRRPPR